MILDRVLALYDREPDLVKRRQPGSGNPTASSVGSCLAQLQMLRFPALSRPEMRSARAAWVFEDGDIHAADLKAKVMRAYPGLTGLSEELFYFGPISLTEDEALVLADKIERRAIWGTLREEFAWPYIRAGRDGSPDRVRLVDRVPVDPKEPEGATKPRPLGFVLCGSNLWAPLYIDHIVRHPDHGLCVIEFKSMSRFAFRRALLAEWDARIRMQLAAIAQATGLPAVWFIKAKDTAHLLEVAFLPKATATTVEIIKTNGQRRRYHVPAPGVAIGPEGRVDLREDETWDMGQLWAPYDLTLVRRIGERIKRVLLFDPPIGATLGDLSIPWDREYGPEFRCHVCEGTGTQTLTKAQPRQPLKKAKPCDECAGLGLLEQAQLPSFPCGYCPVVSECWGRAGATLEVSDKPRWWISRAAYEASGVQWQSPGDLADAEEP